MQQLFSCFLISIVTAFMAAHAHDNTCNVRTYGATACGRLYDTEAVQAAIDSAHSQGGGTVFFPAGKYLLKTIILKTNVGLDLDHGAEILGSTELNRYDPALGSFADSSGRLFAPSLIHAYGATNISISGHGRIDGQGFPEHYPIQEGLARPSIIRFIRCANVKIEDITLVNAAAWVQHYVECDDLTITGITVHSYANKNNDGLDIESCHRVIVSRCNISSEDDSIVLKAMSRRPCRDVVISDCMVSGLKSAIKTGTESAGSFENITISNCVFYGTRGISLLSVDGGDLNNITISNISMRDSYAVLVMRLGARMRPYKLAEEERPQKPGVFRNILVDNIQAVGVTESNDFICGIPDANIEHVTLSNFRICYKGGGQKEDAERHIPELADEYPKAKMFGVLPSYGFFIRHAKNIKIKDISLSVDEVDLRPAIMAEDVSDLELTGIRACTGEQSAPMFWLKQCQSVRIRDSRPMGMAGAFLRVEGSRSDNMVIQDYPRGQLKGDSIIAEDVPENTVRIRNDD